MADTSRYDYADAVNKQILVTVLETGDISDENGHAHEVLIKRMLDRGFEVPQNLRAYLIRLDRDGWLILGRRGTQRSIYSLALNSKSRVEKITRHLRSTHEAGHLNPVEVEPAPVEAEPEPAPSIVVVQERAAGSAADIADALLQKLVDKLQAPAPAADAALHVRIKEMENLLRLRQNTIDTMKRRIDELGAENQILRNSARSYQERGGQLETKIAELIAPEQREALAGLARRPLERSVNASTH